MCAVRAHFRVRVRGEAADRTPKEFGLLRLLSLNAGRVMHRDTIVRRLWAGSEKPKPHLIRIVVRGLRRKLGDSAAESAFIFSWRGVDCRMPRPGDG